MPGTPGRGDALRASARALLAASAAFAVAPARAQASKVTLVVPFPPAGSTGVPARLLQAHLQTRLGRVVLVENKSGAAGSSSDAASGVWTDEKYGELDIK